MMINLDWYHSLQKPALTPPNWVFTPVWIILYFTIICALIIFLKTNKKQNKSAAITAFFIQMIFNILWTPIFFYYKEINIALIVLTALFIALLTTIILFIKSSKPAGLMLIPYLLWTIFALYLNIGICFLNN